MKSRRLWLLLIMLCCLPLTTRAQVNSGMVRGIVRDQAGAVVPGATVSLTNEITGYRQRTRTEADGSYRLVEVPFNRYVLSVSANGFELSSREVVVASTLTQQVDAQLAVAPVKGQVSVSSSTGNLLETDKSAPSVVVDQTRIQTFPTSQPSRATEALVATAPGWTLDANRRLHARGIEYQVQYSMDGIPVTDTVAATFTTSPDPRNFRSMEVQTSNIPAEYGNKLAGVVAVTTRSGLETETGGDVTAAGGSFNTFEGSFSIGGHTRKLGYFLSAAGTRTDRFLDPPSLENFHNRGRAARGFFRLDYAPNERDLFRLDFAFGGTRFEVPNLPDQQIEGQDQRRRTNDNMQSISWQHIFSPNATGYLAYFQRYNSAKLFSNELSTPVFAEQSRHNGTYGLLGALTYNRGRHTFKGGFEFDRFPVTESFTFAITDLAALLAIQPDLPVAVQGFTLANPFVFRDRHNGWEGSAYFQDHFNATPNLTLDLGLRFDSYHFLTQKNFLSPRVGLAYYIPRTKTVLRASYNRFLETPALENLLLSSSESARIFSPGASVGEPNGAPVNVSREWQVDFGFQQQLARYLRFDADFYYRRLQSPPEITNFLETGIIFPANLARSRSKGIETRLDLARVHGFSGFLSYTNMHIYGFAPITGGLFLGEAVDLLGRAGERIKIEEDQRNTAVFEARYDSAPGRVWLLFTGRHDSGYTVELEPGTTRADFAGEFPAKILDEVNFERGFVRPHTVLNFSVGRDFRLSERVGLTGQFNLENLTNNFYLITFESVFSGTTIGRPRSYSGRLSVNFK
ncbi:MAG TPA: TonB-dependent receptor [Pyrinomonadaceae bacterium]